MGLHMPLPLIAVWSKRAFLYVTLQRLVQSMLEGSWNPTSLFLGFWSPTLLSCRISLPPHKGLTQTGALCCSQSWLPFREGEDVAGPRWAMITSCFLRWDGRSWKEDKRIRVWLKDRFQRVALCARLLVWILWWFLYIFIFGTAET